MPGSTLSDEEVRLVKQWAIQDSEAPSEIARRLGRCKSTITRFLKKRSSPKQRGMKAGVARNRHALHIAPGNAQNVHVWTSQSAFVSTRLCCPG